MKNRFLQFSIAILVVLFFGCSTSSDGNGNSNTSVIPLAPTELDGAVVNNQVELTWVDNSTNETGFKIDRKVGSGNWVTEYATVNADVVNYIDASVSGGTTYFYRAYSFNSSGRSLNYSNQFSVTVNGSTTVVPIVPTNLTGEIVNNQVLLSWNDNSTNETGFKIDRKEGTASWTVNYASVATDIETYTDAAVTAGSTYTYRIYSYNSVGPSLGYSNTITVTIPTAINVPGPNVTDIDGYVYQSVTNCNQTWTKQNLNVSKYTDGTPIPQVTDPTQWANLTTGAWCYYNNDSANGIIYGKLYNWYAVAGIYDAASATNPALRKKLAPTGWHVPTDGEWTQLTDCLGGESIAGGKMKATGTSLWISPNTDATNASGFTGLPGSCRGSDGTFNGVGASGFWWSSSESGTAYARHRNLLYYHGFADRFSSNKIYGFSVRCLRD